MISILTDDITPRLEYTLNFVFREILGVDYRLMLHYPEITLPDGPRINYRIERDDDGINIQPAGMLFSKDIHPQKIKINRWHGLPAFFQSGRDSDEIPFDLFSEVFYLISRYEEYLPFAPDQHGRFPSEKSLAVKQGFLDIPVVDLLTFELKKIIQQRWPGLYFSDRSYRFSPTFDIDMAFAHLGKGILRTVSGTVKMALTGKWDDLRDRLNTLLRNSSDPYDNMEYQVKVIQRAGLEARYFILLGDYGRFDKNISYRNERFRETVQKLAESALVGIHPSYASFRNGQIVSREIKRLEEITGIPVTLSRNHFLRISIPATPRILIENKILEDHSIGYSDALGFRAGTCTPFLFYDLKADQVTNLRHYPFYFMDSAYIDQLRLSKEEAISKILEINKNVRKVKGHAIGIWHNYLLSESGPYKGWRRVFENLVTELS